MLISENAPSAIFWIGIQDSSGFFANAVWHHSNASVGDWNLWYQDIVVDPSKLCTGVFEIFGTFFWKNLRCSDPYRFICQIDLNTTTSNSILASYLFASYPRPPRKRLVG
ncbi:uncharacterized protein TRIADDRAFT_59351 [Trichoplax adhaerens]|uniref:C-type lectin domain-containing protein n=1 Tax=Trichoplax adhaerens TaxID=10228 RepID=B3S4U6_TRIAD|nr:predicted protein [Trichoplax adhaerens]EDV22151.1 predicted protein [Trichoplax adhaerens]|eukprot:XP_002115306.1 predicted protein [Trichoplax adhaerens]